MDELAKELKKKKTQQSPLSRGIATFQLTREINLMGSWNDIIELNWNEEASAFRDTLYIIVFNLKLLRTV